MWLPGKRRLWKYYAIRKRSHNYGAFAPFFIGTEHSFAGPDTGRTLLVRHRTKNKTTQKVVYISGGEITHKNIFLRGPILVGLFSSDAGPKIKPPKRWFIFLVAKSPTKNIFLRGPILVGLFSSDTGPKIKPPKRWFIFLVAKSPTKIFFCGARYWSDSSRPTQDQK